MQQMQHYEQALVQGPTDFDDEVERELAKRLSQSAAWSVHWETRLLQEVIQAGNKADLE